MSKKKLTEEEKVFVILQVKDPVPTRDYFMSLPDEFLHRYGYAYYEGEDEYWSTNSWLNPHQFDKEKMLMELYEFLQQRR